MNSSVATKDPLPAREFWIGFSLAVLGAILFSGKAIVVKLTYRYDVDALTVIGFRMLFSLPFFAAIAVYQGRLARRQRIVHLTRRESIQIVFLGCIGYYLSSLFDFIGLQSISAGLERLILFLSPTFVLLITALYLKRPIARRQWAALAISYVGVVLVFLQDLSFSGSRVLVGSAFVMASALSYAFYLIGSGELIKRVGSTRLVAYAMCVSSVATLIHFFLVHGMAGLVQVGEVYRLSIVHAVLNTVIPVFMIMGAVGRIGAPMTAQLGLIGPVSVLFLAFWLLGEPITALQLAGTAVALCGALLLTRH